MPFDVQMPDGTIIQGVPDGTTKADLAAKYASHIAATTAQPSIVDRITASPVGRLVHDAVLSPISSLESFMGSSVNMDPNGPMFSAPQTIGGKAMQADAAQAEGSYQGSLARNRNTPGYASALQNAQAVRSKLGQSGFMDQITAPINSAAAGLSGLVTGGLDQANANADVQSGAQNAYAQANPVKATIAGTIGGLAAGTPELLPTTVARAPLKPMVQTATNAGYTLPPRMVSDDPGALANALQGWSGKVKTAQAASEKNQEVTNNLAKQAIGIPADEDITAGKLQQIRSQAGQAKQNVIQSVPDIHTDPQFRQDVANLSGIRSSVATNFPNIAKNQGIEDLVSDLSNAKTVPTQDAFDVIQRLRQSANANFNAFQDADKLALGQAQRTAANNLEDLIERNLQRNGYTGIQDFKDARQLMAKTYDVEGATTLATGNVTSAKLAAMANKGRPLSGELKTIADVHSAFPNAMQPIDRIGGVEPLSTLDLGAAALSAAHGNYGVGAALLGKPVARAAVLSKTMQRRMTNQIPLVLPRLGSNGIQPLNLAGAGIGQLPQLQNQ